MRWWWPISGDPGDSPPPSERTVNAEIELEDRRPRLVTVDEVGGWLSAAEEREFLVWKEIDSLLKELQPQWPRRTKAIRRELAWLRSEAKKLDYKWGR